MSEKKELSAKYNPAEVEDKWYAWWTEHKCFHSEPNEKEPYTIVIPPPNVTGILHMGHVLNNTLNDVLIRKARMDGKNACWVPGTDHASIATESKVVAKLKGMGISKEDLTREEFMKYAWEWKEEHGGIILKQLRKLGASCDWDRTRFTMEPELSDAVIATFCYFYKRGMIYRGVRMVNWDPVALTAISDDEVIHRDTKSHFYHLKYYISDGNGNPTDKYLVIATTRPETIMADAAICVNPADERHHWLKGKKVLIPLINREIPVIEDSYVEMDFGTGCLKVTPAHDAHDYEIGLRHNLPVIDIIDDHGRLNEKAQILVGEDRFEARKKIVKMLEESGNLVKVEEYTSPVGYSERTNAVIEPKLSAQWFLKMEDLAAKALESVESGKIKLIPDKYRNTYRHWMENAHDWCISRQLWWGHRIPAFYCRDCGEMTVSREDVTVCPKCGSHRVEQESDVLDTWFSSALWPFSTLGWPEKTADLAKYYPTSVLVTGYDIIFFWVARMIFSGLEQMGDVPFHTVFIHGLVRDAQGRKMSKSLGNGIDPLEIIDRYGADALRFALSTGNSPGNDMRFSEEKMEAARNFANKLWNASRFVRMNLTVDSYALPAADELAPEDKWILTAYNKTVRTVTDALDHYEVGVALSAIYDFVWDIFCDWYIELTKSRLTEKGTAGNLVAQNVLCYVLTGILKLLHPFMPFITEEIYQALPHCAGAAESIVIADYPKYDPSLEFAAESLSMSRVIGVIKAIRLRRNEMNIAPSRRAKVYLETKYADSFGSATYAFFVRLASASAVEVAEHFPSDVVSADNAVQVVTDSAVVYLPLSELIDVEKEKARLAAEREKMEGEILRVEKKLSNESFVSKAPAAVVDAERAKLSAYREKLSGILSAIGKLG